MILKVNLILTVNFFCYNFFSVNSISLCNIYTEWGPRKKFGVPLGLHLDRDPGLSPVRLFINLALSICLVVIFRDKTSNLLILFVCKLVTFEYIFGLYLLQIANETWSIISLIFLIAVFGPICIFKYTQITLIPPQKTGTPSISVPEWAETS